MAKHRKYSSLVESDDSSWKAKILRQVTSKKTHISKEQHGFATQEEAQSWAEAQLAEFSKTQGVSNQRHTEQRKSNEEERRQRSSRRANKTLLAKNSKSTEAEEMLHNETDTDQD